MPSRYLGIRETVHVLGLSRPEKNPAAYSAHEQFLTLFLFTIFLIFSLRIALLPFSTFLCRYTFSIGVFSFLHTERQFICAVQYSLSKKKKDWICSQAFLLFKLLFSFKQLFDTDIVLSQHIHLLCLIEHPYKHWQSIYIVSLLYAPKICVRRGMAWCLSVGIVCTLMILFIKQTNNKIDFLGCYSTHKSKCNRSFFFGGYFKSPSLT